MKELNAEYDRVFVIDLLSETERQTHNISGVLIKLLGDNGIEQELQLCRNKRGLSSGLRRIVNYTKSGKKCLIHFVAHGNRSCIGWKHTGETLKWGELPGTLATINGAQGGVLVLNFTSCIGINGIKIRDYCRKGVPFFGVIGPLRKIGFPEALRINDLFYKKWFTEPEIPYCVLHVNQEMKETVLWCQPSEFPKKP